jgi:uncharacterized protein (DUF488 family)
MKRGTLYPVGYVHPDAAAQLEQYMRDEHTLLIDIRYSPRSRWHPQWTKNALTTRYGTRYLWDQRLGNLNYRHPEQDIQLAAGHQQAAQEAAAMLRDGKSLVLLCACKDYERCHRKRVRELIQACLEREVQ